MTFEQGTGMISSDKAEGIEELTCIDTDVHEKLVSPRQLLPYLDEKWHRWILEGKYHGVRPMPYVRVAGRGADRYDSKPSDGSPPGSDVQFLQQQLFNETRISVAILTGALDVYFAAMETQIEFYTALASAYNDWLVENWLEKDARFRGSIQITPQDPESAAREIDRMANHPQMVQVILPIISQEGYGKPFYDPIFEAVERNGLVLGMHQGWSSKTAIGWPPYYVEWHSNVFQPFMSQVSSMIFGGVFEKFPKLRVALIEGGFAWVPILMWKLDQNYKAVRHEVPWLNRLPSEYIRDHFRAATQPMEEPDKPHQLMQIIEMIGNDKFLMFSTDYPHWDFDHPKTALRDIRNKTLRQRILADNAREWYRL
jgi:predicted TIM-barrel fold metal-dependent hydrolase